MSCKCRNSVRQCSLPTVKLLVFYFYFYKVLVTRPSPTCNNWYQLWMSKQMTDLKSSKASNNPPFCYWRISMNCKFRMTLIWSQVTRIFQQISGRYSQWWKLPCFSHVSRHLSFAIGIYSAISVLTHTMNKRCRCRRVGRVAQGMHDDDDDDDDELMMMMMMWWWWWWWWW